MNQIKNKTLSAKKISLLIMCLSTCSLFNTDPCFSVKRTHNGNDESPRPIKRQRLVYHPEESSSDEDSHGSSSESSSEDDRESEDVSDDDSYTEERMQNMYKFGRQQLVEGKKKSGVNTLKQVALMGNAHYRAKAYYWLGLEGKNSSYMKIAAEAGYAPARAVFGLHAFEQAVKNQKSAAKKRAIDQNLFDYLENVESVPKGAYTLAILYKNSGETRKAEELLKRSETALKGTKKALASYYISKIILNKIIEKPNKKIHDAEFNTYLQKAKAEQGLIEKAGRLETTFNELTRTTIRAETMKDCLEQPSGSKRPRVQRPPVKVKNPSQFSAIHSDEKGKMDSFQKKKDEHDQQRLERHIKLAEREREEGNEALSLYHQTEIIDISDTQEDRSLARSIANGSNNDGIRVKGLVFGRQVSEDFHSSSNGLQNSSAEELIAPAATLGSNFSESPMVIESPRPISYWSLMTEWFSSSSSNK